MSKTRSTRNAIRIRHSLERGEGPTGSTARWMHLRTAAALMALVVVLALTGCGSASQPSEPTTPPPATAQASFPVTITDDAGRTVTVEAAPERIVSLAPANTEILFALGLGDKVVGVTSYDDYPTEVADIAKVGDFTGPNIEAVAAADPDLVVATTGVQSDAITRLEELGATVIAVDPQSIAGVYENITEVGQVTGAVAAAEELVAEMKEQAEEVSAAIADAEKVTAFIEIGQDPLFTAGTGTLINELLEAAGGENVVSDAGYVPYSVEQLVEADPAVYMATKGTMSDPDALDSRAGYAELSAIKNDRVIILDDNLVTRPGPRVVEGLRQIAEGLHPSIFGGQ